MSTLILVGLIIIGTVLLTAICIPIKVYKKLFAFIRQYFAKRPKFAEVCRFIIIGGISTLIDFLVMGFVEYFMEMEKYASLLNIFINCPPLSTFTVVFANAIGFIVGLIFNYTFSILFVYTEKGNSKSVKGFSIFAFLSFIGLVLNLTGMYLMYDLLGINQWISKILITLIVLVYNYLSRKHFIFSKAKNNIIKINDTKDSSLSQDK